MIKFTYIDSENKKQIQNILKVPTSWTVIQSESKIPM